MINGAKTEAKAKVPQLISVISARWRHLTTPTTPLADATEQHTARLLASVLLAVVALSGSLIILGLVAYNSYWPSFEARIPFLSIAFTNFVLQFGAYRLSRTRNYRWAAILMVILSNGAIFVAASQSLSKTAMLNFLVVPILLSSLFFPLRFTFRLAVFNLAGIIVFAMLSSDLDLGHALVGPFSFNLVVSSLIILVTHYRNGLEASRQLELDEANQKQLAERQRMLDALQLAHDQLEERVAERTASLTVLNARLRAEIGVREETQAALHESETLYRQLAENIQQFFWVIELPSFRVAYLSPACAGIFGRDYATLWKDPRILLHNIHPDDAVRIREMAENLGKGECDEEFRVVRPDGEICWVRTRTFPIRNDEGQVYRVAGLTDDVTAIRRSALELQEALAQEKELGELKSRFVTMASHEFRTPLSTILTSTEMLQEYGSRWNEERKAEHLCRILEGVERINQLLEEILLVGRVEAGKLAFSPGPVDIVQLSRELVEEATLSLRPVPGLNADEVEQAKVERVSFEACIYSPSPRWAEVASTPNSGPTLASVDSAGKGRCKSAENLNVIADPKLFRLILANLLSNALKYSLPESGLVRLELELELDYPPTSEADGHNLSPISGLCSPETNTALLWVRVRDEGIGIAEADWPWLFSSFHRGSNVGLRPGNGLGLTIVKQAVELHRGSLSFESEIGRGTTFTVCLPVGLITG